MSTAAWKEIVIPKNLLKWFASSRSVPVRALIDVKAKYAQVEGGPPYRIHVVKKDHYEFIRTLGSGVAVSLGEVTRNGVQKTLSDAVRHDLLVFRTLLFGGAYPGPVAYVMANGDHVHVGDCFSAHPSVIVQKTLFVLPNSSAQCAICHEGFIE